MKLCFLNRIKNVRSPILPQHITTHFFSTKPKSLFSRIAPLGDPNFSITPILDEWVEQGNPVAQIELQNIIKELRYYGRFKHALEVSTWMTEKMYMRLSPRDVAFRMHLIYSIHGIGEVESCFNHCSSKLKGHQVYVALLNCYCHEKAVEKAEETFQIMKDNKMVRTPIAYNSMMNLYKLVGNHDKMDETMAEMEENGLDHDQFTLCTRFDAYAAAIDIAGMNKIVQRIESTPTMKVDWKQYSILADGYLRVDQTGKAVEMLEKIEEQMARKGGNEKKNFAYDFLLKSYARAGMKSRVFHVWELYEKRCGILNRGYISMIESLLLLDDIEAAEKIFDEWESRNLTYDTRIPKLLVDAYSKKGLVEKAKTLTDRISGKGNEACA